ncbi:MAG: ester cyclase [Acidimicrobiia bacterium]|nr:ester cyclase [Acidimicrobiia bacterium]
MSTILERVMPLWSGPLPEGDDALAQFRAVYADPVEVNGTPTDLRDLVDRARMLQRAFGRLQHEVLQVVEAGDHLAVAFRLRGHHLGPLETPLGPVPPTGRRLEVQGMDIFELCLGRIHALWAVADQLDLLLQAEAVALRVPTAPV